MKHNDIEFYILPQTPNKQSSDTRRNKVKEHKRKVKSTGAVISQQMATGNLNKTHKKTNRNLDGRWKLE